MTGLEARGIVEGALRQELYGPSPGQEPQGTPVDCSTGSIHFETKDASRGRFHDSTTLQEILTQSDPLRRYGIGVLFNGAAARGTAIAAAANASDGFENPDDTDITWVQGLGENEDLPDGPTVDIKGKLRFDEADSDDFDLTDANTFKPSAMAVSFKCRVPVSSSMTITVTGAYYDKITAHIPGLAKSRDWWVRRPFELTGIVAGEVLLRETNRLKTVSTASVGEPPRNAPVTEIFSRPVPREAESALRLVTVAVKNTAPGSGAPSALFQVGFTVAGVEGLRIEPYPEIEQPDRDNEEQSIDLLYRHKRTYAIGHGCAADWDDDAEQATPWVRADPMPAYEVVSLTPDVYIKQTDGSRTAVTVSMEALANGTSEGREQVEMVLRLYDEWITEQEGHIPTLLPRFQPAAARHMDLCRGALARMRTGWAMVGSDSGAARAFQLANEAMFFQQIRSRFPVREVERGKNDILRVQGAHPQPVPQPGSGNWRPFQIAFVLASLPELVDPTAPARSLVDLIFFPTGGGKTEAYLGASAISMLARRLRDPDDVGTDTLMRYTLRLLTAQQFLRAAALVCVLEDIRINNPAELGEGRFGIGIWLGGSSTPNTWKQAVSALKAMRRDPFAQNPFLLLRCPWCGAQMGTKPRGRTGQDVIGYEEVSQKVILRCVDSSCRFSGRRGLPVHVVDDDIYDVRPSIVIGTVDKFAMLAWRPAARRIFGLGETGDREVSPPSLIIQDELHLISGPLGSMVGLYEAVIDDLCTDKRLAKPVVPKIIASTATIRRYEDQIRGLFGRDRVALFPPHGLQEGRSFFAEPATSEDGSPEPGRRYIGVMSASLGSMQTVQVRVAAATLQAGTQIPEPDRDGYWTNLNFLNSLRELGNTVSLLESDVPDYLTGLRHRDDIDPRWPKSTMELTSRRRSDEIPKAIEQLQTRYGDQGCVDICLASNIIEVGIDIDRLGLMTIVGQPKTTAQYIQVSGRVGRKAEVSPGLVITIYGAAKPRDRSHYERFRTYHQRLYAQVEPTSVTPFATPVLRRAMHAAVVAHIRQVTPYELSAYPFPRQEFEEALGLLKERAAIADPDEMPSLVRIARARARQWESWERTTWDANVINGDPKQGLMRFAGTLPDLDSKASIWDVPASMRNVDAECRLKISLAYNRADAALESDL